MPANAPHQPAATPHRLKPNALGVLGILFLVLSAQAPLTGIAGAVPLSVALGNGPGVPAAYVAAGAVVLLFSVGFTAMSRHVVDPGAFYTYIGKGLGRTTGTGSAAVALFAYCTIQAAMYGLYGATVAHLLRVHTDLDLPWWVWALLTMALVELLGTAGIDTGTRVLAVFVVAETSILLVFAAVVLVRGGGPEGLDVAASFSPHTVLDGAPGVAVMFAVASMFGFEATAVYGEEARSPERTVPRATYLSITLITAFFALTSWMIISAHGASHAAADAGKALEDGDSSAFVFQPIADRLGDWTGDLLPVLLATSLFAGILAFHNSANRYLFSLGRERRLPHVLCTLNRRGAPWTAGVAQTAIAVLLVVPFALAGRDPVVTLFSWFSGVAVLAIMLLYFLTSVSVVVYFRRHRPDRRRWNTTVAPSLGALGIAGAIWLVLANLTTLIGGDRTTATWLALTIPVVWLLGAAAFLARPGERATAPAPSSVPPQPSASPPSSTSPRPSETSEPSGIPHSSQTPRASEEDPP
ncbi:APC family permease [Streptomyces tsukubensis]|uniref:APC family permease n=1 Tax=Streptomyces tsukubensis TaxID=83656 RepID=UPI00098F186E|nr:APC family permease [Streptomyces tsukubensis]QFR96891.1 amino acid permease [Streptomyces tsukubensis]